MMPKFPRISLLSALILSSAVLSGCGIGTQVRSAAANGAGGTVVVSVEGHVRGGQQPVTGAQVYLYTTSTTSNAGSSTSLLSGPAYVTTDANGNFQIPAHVCPVGSYVYVLALDGNPGLMAGTSNPYIALAAGLGSCEVAANMTVNIDEVTTVATAFALSGYSDSETQIGANIASTPDAVNLGDGFAAIPNYVDLPSGVARSTTLDGTGTIPQATINSLADSLAPCVNSNGTGSPCSSLMSAANVVSGSTTPVDTFQAALNIAQNPGNNVAAIYALANADSPFQPTLASAPLNWSLGITYPTTGAPAASVTLTPTTSTITQFDVQDFIATVSGLSAPDYSYQWTVSGSNGTLNESGDQGRTQQTTFCSTSNVVVYQPNTSPNYATADSVTVQVFAGPGCVAGSLIGASSAAAIALTQSSAPSVPYVPAIPTTNFTGTVSLPSGSTLTPPQLTVLTTIAPATPAANGTFTIPTYLTGSQIAVVNAPSGNPIMLGWMDSTHATISAQSTAEVFAYYAMGGATMQNPADRTQLESLIAVSSGLPNLTQAVSAEIVANPNGFSQLDPNLQGALNAYFTTITGITPSIAKPGVNAPRPLGILVNPDATTTQSGMSVQQVPPYEANVVNTYRRHALAFVTRVSDNFGSGVVQDAQDFGQTDVPPAVGLTGGVLGTLVDIFNAHFGNQPTAYGPITSDNFSVPLTANSQTTTYTVTIVGPGGTTAVSNGLTEAQATAQVQVAVGGFVTDALVPFFANFAFGSGLAPNYGVESVGEAEFAASFRNNLTNDLLNYLSNSQTLQAQITQGQWGQAMNGLLYAAGTSGTLQTLIAGAAAKAAGNINLPTSTFSKAMSGFFAALQAAGGVLQVFDSAVYVHEVGGSDAADQWTVTVSPQKINFLPAASFLQQTGAAGTGSQTLTVTLPGVDSLVGYSFMYTNTANAGDLTAFYNPGQGTSFCSTSTEVNYTVRAIPILTINTMDTITVQAFTGPGCKAANLVATATATATVLSTGVVLTPASATIMQQGPGQVGLTASVAANLPNPVSYSWVVNGTQGASTVGTLTEVGGNNMKGQTSYCSVSPSATYVANSSPALSSTGNDQVTVQAFSGSNCASGTSIATSLPSLITVTPVSVLLQPLKPALQQNQQVTMTATVQGQVSNGTYSYRWTTSGNAGILEEIGGTGQTGTSYCSTSLQADYTPNDTPVLATAVTDTVSVQVFSGAGCVVAQAVSGVASTPVQVMPVVTVTSTSIPAPIFLQAGDGYYYGVGSNNSGAFLLQYNSNLVVQKSISLPSTVIVGYGYFRAPILGPDGNLYGYSPSGNYRVTLPAGTVTLLNSPDSAMILTALGNDGNFYGYTGMGYQAPDYTQPGEFSRMDITGVVTPIVSFPAADDCTTTAPNCNFLYTSLQASDGNFYALGWQYDNPQPSGSGAVNCSVTEGQINNISPGGAFSFVAGFNSCSNYNGVMLNSNISFNPTQNTLIEGADGALYGITAQSGSIFQQNELVSGGGPLIFRESGGSIQPLFQLPQYLATANPLLSVPDGGYFNFTYGLIPGSDGNLYGATICLETAADTNGAVNCPGGQLFQVSTAGQYFPMYTFGTSAGTTSDHEAPVLQNSTGALMGFYTHYNASNTPAIVEFVASLPLPAPIQLRFTDPSSGDPITSIPTNSPATLTWKVLNAFSLTAQQCTAQVQTFPTGAGTWTGIQLGTTSNDPDTGLPVYGSSTTITPTSAGTYTYALTCGGYESGYATLQVTP